MRELLKSPTPENFEAVNEKLTGLIAALQSFIANPSAIKSSEAKDAAFLSRLPSEMARIRLLLQSPVKFLQELTLFRVKKFGSYDRQGQVKGLDQEASTRTLTHL
jgi:hypothetical protein